MTCSVFGCRFREKHDTKNHTCGTCKKSGHGVRECPNNNFGIEDLKVYYLSRQEMLNIYNKRNSGTLTDYLTIPKRGYYYETGLGMGHSAVVRNDNGKVQVIYLTDYHNMELSDLNKNHTDLNLVKVFTYGFKSQNI